MNAPAQAQSFPLLPIALRLTAVAVAIGLFMYALLGSSDPAMLQTGLIALVGVWLVNVASVVFVSGFAPRGAMPVAMAHYAAAGGRLLLCVGLGVLAVKQWDMPTTATLIALASAYIPLLLVEAVAIAGYVRRVYVAPVDAKSEVTG